MEWLKADKTVAADRLGAMGFCIGGHLAFRAALNSEVKAAVCCYPTGIHSGKLGRGVTDTIDRVGEIQGEVLTIFGTLDPHVPPEGQQAILAALDQSGVVHKSLVYEADHTFMRDDGYRYDSVATDAAWGEIIAFLQQKLTR